MSNQNVLRINDIKGGLRTKGIEYYHKIKILVMAETYPLPNGRVRTSNYFHERNKYYKSKGIGVTVLNFSTSRNYSLDGIEVINESEWKKKAKTNNYDVLISHAPNIKHHLLFLFKYESKFKHIIFFFHGQEILRINKVYPKPFFFQKQSILKRITRSVYDSFKLIVWKQYLPKIADKADYIFVSGSLMDQFFDGTRIRKGVLDGKCHIVNNGIGEKFENIQFDYSCEKRFDFITVRSNMDSPTYCIDILCKLAEKYQGCKFLLIGEGQYFNHYTKPNNISVINTTLDHADLIEKLQMSRVALMLTRNDTQGVMSCEIASIGMPLITSKIKVCQEVFSCFPNVRLVENNPDKINLTKIMNELEQKLPYRQVRNYYSENTARKEYDIIKGVMYE